MRIIAHRGNLEGVSRYENTIGQISMALNRGVEVEIDVWKLPGEEFFRLGHDKPIMHESVNLGFLKNAKIWCHCKNEVAFNSLKNIQGVNAFVQIYEPKVRTTTGAIWWHSDARYPHGVNVILGDKFPDDVETFFGVCTDHPMELLRMTQ